MKTNQLTDILDYWNQMSFSEKATALQKFENINAQFLNRPEREIILTSHLLDLDDDRTSYFYSQNPTCIFVNDKKEVKPITLAMAVYQSGLFALLDDFYKNKSDLVFFSPRNKEDFLKEHLVESVIKNNSFDFENGLNILGQEQRYAQRESALYLAYTLLSACQTRQDCAKLYNEYGTIFDNYYLYLDKCSAEPSKLSYYHKYLNSLNERTYPDNLPAYLASFKKEFVLPPQLNKPQIEFLINHFDKNLKLFTAFKEVQTKEEKIDNYKAFFNNFVSDCQELGQ